MQTSFIQEIRAELRSIQNCNVSDDENVSNLHSNTSTSSTNTFEMWTWGGKLHMVPMDFKFPICNVRTLWDLWWTGHVQNKIKPYRYLRKFDIQGSNEKSYLAKGRAVMGQILKYGLEASTVQSINLVVGERD